MENENSQKTKILAASMAAGLAFLADIYLINNMPRNYPVLGVISLIFIISLYLAVSGVIKWKENEALKRQEQYQNMVRAEKASYLLNRKNYREMQGKVNCLDIKIDPLAKAGEVNHQKISALLDILMQEQKKIAKITVSRNKENANALMNSNDKVIEKIFEMQDAMGQISENFGNQTEGLSQKEFADIKENQKELTQKIMDIEKNINHQMELLMKKLAEVTIASAKQELPVSGKQIEPEYIPQEWPEPSLEDLLPEEAIETIETVLEDLLPEESIESSLENLLPEEVIESSLEDLLPEEVIESSLEDLLPEKPSSGGMMTPEEIAALIAQDTNTPTTVPSEKTVAVDEIAPKETPVPQRPMTHPDNIVTENSNKIMTPEEIAALISGVGEVSADIPEPPEPPEKPEEKPPLPDMSNPNKVMSPEDIAALIANM